MPTPTKGQTMPSSKSITVTDTGGRVYSARILTPGDPYGNGAIWGEVFYQQGRIGITIDHTPATYFASPLAQSDGKSGLWIDFGAGWRLTDESTERFVALARTAVAQLAELS